MIAEVRDASAVKPMMERLANSERVPDVKTTGPASVVRKAPTQSGLDLL